MQSHIRVIVICAHPDEADEYAGGTAALFAELGGAVKFVALTNGDAGHYQQSGAELAARRFAEAQEAGRRLGAVYDVLNTHDGELFPTLAVRHQVIRAIREWRADIVIGFHPNGGGHPDNRNAGKAVRDAMAFVSTPNILPTVPALARDPIHLYMTDYATQSIHRPDLTIDIDSTIEKKLRSWDAHASQFYEFAPWGRGVLDQVGESWEEKRIFLLTHWAEFFDVSPAMRASLERWYGLEHAASVRFAEAFQFADERMNSNTQAIRALFPMLR